MTTPLAKMLNVRIPKSLGLKLEAVARATDRTKSFVAVKALEQYLETESWQIRDIQEGIREADAKHFATPKEVEAVFSKYGA